MEAFRDLGYAPVEVRRPEQLDAGITHLVLPGGESTTLHKLLELYGMWEPIARKGRSGELALFGTCAGAILLGRPNAERPPRLGLIDVAVDRNAYGRQVDSFLARVELAGSLAGDSFDGVFIRAPQLHDLGTGVEVLGTLRGEPVLVREGRMLAATFHPELTPVRRLHEYFLAL